MPPRALRTLCVAAGTLLGVVAAIHAVKAARGEGDVTRHLVFVAIDGALGVLVAWRPRWALVPLLVLLLQQLGTHGRDLARSLRGPGPLDVESLIVLAFFVAVLALVIAVRRQDERPGYRHTR
jgi:hypothetical protein